MARTPFFYGWVIVVLAALCSFWGPGVVQRSYTVILKPLTDDLAVPRTVGVLGVTLAALVGDLASPLVGWLVDRQGARVLVAASAVVTGLTLVALSLVQDAWLFLLLFGGVLGLARPSLQAVGAQTSVAKWFVRRRGRAVTFSTLGLPISAVVIIPVTEWMVAAWDWRAAWGVLGFGVLLGLALPAALFMRGAPEESGLLPDGDSAPSETRHPGGPPPQAPEADWEARDAFRTRAFWALSLGFAIIGMVPTILSLHMFPYFTDQRIPPATAAVAAGSFGVWVVVSRIAFWGAFLERAPVRVTLLLWSVLMTVAITCMLFVNGPLLAFAAAGSFGIAMGGTAPLQTIAWARYYGRRALGAITGVATLIGIVNAVLGPIMPSVVYDLTGSYHGAFVATGIACFAGIALFGLAGAPQTPRAAGGSPAAG